jgi:hypothetical protein
LAGRGAEAVRDTIAATITTLPERLRQELTWDRGKEMVQHTQLKIDTGVTVYFADPHSPWQRGTNENTNGLLRQYFPKGTDLSQEHRSVSLGTRRTRRGCHRTQQPTMQDTRLEDTRRGLQRATTVALPRRCCNDWLSPSPPPWSVWKMTPRTSLPRTATATCNAAVASAASWRGLIANPTQRRECRSRIATR